MDRPRLQFSLNRGYAASGSALTLLHPRAQGSAAEITEHSALASAGQTAGSHHLGVQDEDKEQRKQQAQMVKKVGTVCCSSGSASAGLHQSLQIIEVLAASSTGCRCGLRAWSPIDRTSHVRPEIPDRLSQIVHPACSSLT